MRRCRTWRLCSRRPRRKCGPQRWQDALAIGLIGGTGFGRALGRLLSDPDDSVRSSAVHASAQLRDPMLVAPLVMQLSHVEFRAPVIEALEMMPESAVPL